VFFHSRALSQSPSLHILKAFSGPLAVQGFFVISGFLIFASYERSKSLGDYFAKRARRILPGYWLSTAVCIVIAVYFTHGLRFGKFLFANLTFMNFLQPEIAGVFPNNPEHFLNVSLWTIKVEIMFYIAVPIVVWIGRRIGSKWALLLGIAGSLAYRAVFAHHEQLLVQLPGQFPYFAVGALGFYHLGWFKRWSYVLVLPAALLFAFQAQLNFFLLRPIAIGILVLTFCLTLPKLPDLSRWGDFSYGIYVLHCPIMQTLIAVGLFQRSPWGAVLITLATVFLAAVLSWHFVEKPWLARRPKPAPVAAEKLELAAQESAVPNVI
jgi:peptidoglycan/LPS O-acetylase OafA/YrhL